MIKNNLYPRIDRIFPNQKTNMIKSIFNYIDKNHEILKIPELNYRPSFSDTDRDVIYSAMGISSHEMTEEAKKSDDIVTSRNISANPFYLACTLLTGWCVSKKDEQTAKLIVNYMSFMMYTSLHYKYAKFDANEEAMRYTISQLNNSFDLKKYGTLLKLIEANTETLLETYKTRLIKSTDEDLGYFVNAVFSRLNSKLKKVFRRYYHYKKSGQYQNKDSESTDPENFRTISNDYQVIATLADKVSLNFVMGKIPKDVTKYAIVGTEVSLPKFNSLIVDIKSEDDNSVKEFIMDMIAYAVYYNQMPFQYLGTSKYLNIMASGYTSNTNSVEMNRIKEQLDNWVSDNANKHGRAAYGKTASNGYKKAIYNYFMYAIYNDAK